MTSRTELQQRLDANLQARIANLAEAQRILQMLRAIADQCQNDAEFFQRMPEVRALNREQQVTADRQKQLRAEQDEIEAELASLGPPEK